MRSTRPTCTIFIVLIAALSIQAQTAAPQQSTRHHHYQLIDMGTFGGPSSYFTIVGTRPVNMHGTATGAADTTIPDPYAPNCFFPECLVAHTFAYENGHITDLGSLSGVNNSGPNDINAKGVIVGICAPG